MNAHLNTYEVARVTLIASEPFFGQVSAATPLTGERRANALMEKADAHNRASRETAMYTIQDGHDLILYQRPRFLFVLKCGLKSFFERRVAA